MNKTPVCDEKALAMFREMGEVARRYGRAVVILAADQPERIQYSLHLQAPWNAFDNSEFGASEEFVTIRGPEPEKVRQTFDCLRNFAKTFRFLSHQFTSVDEHYQSRNQ